MVGSARLSTLSLPKTTVNFGVSACAKKIFRGKNVVNEVGPRKSQPGVLGRGGAHGQSTLRREASISRFQSDVEYSAGPESGAPRVKIHRKLGVLYKGATVLEAA